MLAVSIEHFGILVSLISLLFTFMFVLVGWMFKASSDVNKRISEVYSVISIHHECAEIHGKKELFTTRVECQAVTAGIRAIQLENKADMTEIKRDVKTLLMRPS